MNTQLHEAQFDAVEATSLYGTAIGKLNIRKLRLIFDQGVRVYFGVSDFGSTLVELSIGNDEHGAYSDCIAQLFDRNQCEFFYLSPDELHDYPGFEYEPSNGELDELKDYLADACSNDAVDAFDKFAEENLQFQDL